MDYVITYRFNLFFLNHRQPKQQGSVSGVSVTRSVWIISILMIWQFIVYGRGLLLFKPTTSLLFIFTTIVYGTIHDDHGLLKRADILNFYEISLLSTNCWQTKLTLYLTYNHVILRVYIPLNYELQFVKASVLMVFCSGNLSHVHVHVGLCFCSLTLLWVTSITLLFSEGPFPHSTLDWKL